MSEAAVAGFWEELGKELGEEKAWGATALWHRAHEELVRLAATRAGLDYEEGQWLLRAERSGVHLRLGYGSFREYVERLFGYSPRLVQEKLRVADALEGLPVLSAELEHGRLSFSAVGELSRVATPATERAWLEAARGLSIREIESWSPVRSQGTCRRMLRTQAPSGTCSGSRCRGKCLRRFEKRWQKCGARRGKRSMTTRLSCCSAGERSKGRGTMGGRAIRWR